MTLTQVYNDGFYRSYTASGVQKSMQLLPHVDGMVNVAGSRDGSDDETCMALAWLKILGRCSCVGRWLRKRNQYSVIFPRYANVVELFISISLF